ncbi:MAG: hypothetical protein HN368_17060 [Spirochaetales bacterium]|jgi:hypothetical protein|nr:hypothetical protein [Spirochaetales bacterium]
MTNRERFRRIMNFKSFDRLPILEWAGWWDKTIDRWHDESLPTELTDRYEICTYFGLDIYKQEWLPVRGPDCPKPASHGAGIISDEDGYDLIKKHLYSPDAVNAEQWKDLGKKQADGSIVVWFSLDGFFWFARTLLGIERHLYAFYDQPDLMHRMNNDLTEWMIQSVEKICEYCSPDFMTFAEDMSYNHGPMLSEDLFDEFMLPYYHRIIPVLRKHKITSIVDSDGDITVPAAWFERAGIEGILPLERQSGVDINTLRENHPRMRFIGHYDKMVMNKGEAAMRAEFERLLPAASKGGFLISCDHQTPPGVSYNNYQIYMKLFKEYALKAGDMS